MVCPASREAPWPHLTGCCLSCKPPLDAGESWAAPAVTAGLAAEGITRLDYGVATHDHDDHIGGMTGVLPQVTVGQFVTNGVPASTQTAINLRTYLSTHSIATDAATAGDTLALDPANVTVTVLNPPPDPGTDQNEASVVLRLVFGSQSFLLAGDVGRTAEGWILGSGRPVAARFLKVGHHGSSTASARVRDQSPGKCCRPFQDAPVHSRGK